MVTVAEKTARSGGRFIANNDSLILIHWCSRSHFKPFSNSPRIFIKSLPTIWPLDGNVDCFHLIFNRMIHDVSSHIAPIVRGNQLHTLSQTPKLQAVLMSHTARWALSKFFWWWLLLLLLGTHHATAARAWSNICIHQHKVDNTIRSILSAVWTCTSPNLHGVCVIYTVLSNNLQRECVRLCMFFPTRPRLW